MVRLSQLPTPSITLTAWFHAYVLCGVIGIRWGKHSPYYANSNPSLYTILVEYLTYAYEEDEWPKGRVLEAMRYHTALSIKAHVRNFFPSLFPRNKRARPLEVPIELKDKNVNFDHNRLAQWKQRAKAIKQEIAMNENAVEQEAAETVEMVKTVETVQPATDSNDKGINNRVTVNFFIPDTANAEDLTLENYREKTGKRFRMTKDQAVTRGLNRTEAFQESKALAISQLGDK